MSQVEKLSVISNEYITVTVSAKGAELKSIVKNGKELLWQGDPRVWDGQAPVLFPICGCLKDGKFTYNGKEYFPPKHGFARLSDLEIETHEQEKAVFLLRSDEETLKQYPFSFEFRVIYSLEKTKLTVTYHIRNTGGKDMYFSVGGHEGYACPDGIEAYSLLFEEPENLDSVLLTGPLLSHETVNLGKNTKELSLKNEYFSFDTLVFLNLKSEAVTLQNRNTEESVRLNFSGSTALLVWSKPDAEFVCLEPWCGLPDYIDCDGDIANKKGMIKLSPNEVCEKSHHIIF